MNGDIRIEVEGLMLERLIERALHEGAEFKRISRMSSKRLCFETDAHGAEILQTLCERFSLDCRLTGRRGRNALQMRIRRRLTLVAGMVTCIAVLSLFLSRIWLIDVELNGDGREKINTNALTDMLTVLGVRPGIATSSIDSALLSRTLAAAAPDFSFVGVRIQGVRLLIEATPAVPEPEVYDIEGARDLVAERDGVVLAINVASGEACVKPGDTVVRGQLLIRGEERVSSEQTRSIAALGTVVARTWYTGEAFAPLSQTVTLRTGVSSMSSALRLMDFEWPLVQGESYASQEEFLEVLPVGGLFLPLEIHRTTAYETNTHIIEVELEPLKQSLSALAFAEAGMKLSIAGLDDCEISDRWIDFFEDDAGNLHARAVYETHTDIAATRDALYDGGV